MSDREARALAAGDAIRIGDEEYRLSPISIQQLAEIQRTAVKYYRNSYLSTIKDNLDFIESQAEREKYFDRKLTEVASWDLNNLPDRTVYDADNLEVTDALKQLVVDSTGHEASGDDEEEQNQQWRSLLEAALNQGKITPQQVKEAVGKGPDFELTPYDFWWISSTWEGRLMLVYESVRIEHHRLKKTDVGKWPFVKVAEAVKRILTITTPAVGNT